MTLPAARWALMSVVELALDSGEQRTLRVGDVLIHRGTMHGWRNPSETEAARMVCFVLLAERREE